MTPKSNYLSSMNKENYMGFKKLSEQGNTEELIFDTMQYLNLLGIKNFKSHILRYIHF